MKRICCMRGGTLAVVAGAAVSAFAPETLGQTTNWLNPVSGTWGNAANWSNGVPTLGGTANVTATGAAYTVSLDGTFSTTNLTLGAAPGNTDATLALSNRTLTLRGAYAQRGSELLGSGGQQSLNVLNVGGNASFDTALLMSARVVTRATTTFLGAGDNDICDTDMDHRGTAMIWNGTGRIVINGVNGRLTNGAKSTFTISNDQNIVRTLGGTPRFVNTGRVVKSTGAGTTFIDNVELANTGTIEVQTGTLRANSLAAATFAGGTLLTGTWNVLNGRTLQLDGVNITTSNAAVTLSGAGSTFAAIDGLTTLGTTGKLTIQSGRDFTTAGNFTNNGVLTVGSGQTFRVAPGSALTNLSAGTIAAGSYVLGGVLKVDGASITELDAKLTLDGTGSGIVNESDVDALTGLARSRATSELTVKGGRQLTSAAATYTIDSGAKLTVGVGSRLTLNVLDAGAFSANRLSRGIFDVAGVLRFDSADIREIGTSLTLSNSAADIQDENGVSAIGAIERVTSAGSLTIAGGKQVTTASTFTMESGATLRVQDPLARAVLNTFANFDPSNGGSITGGAAVTVGRGGTLQFSGAAFTRVPTGLTVLPGGKVQNLSGVDAFSALNTVQTGATFGVDSGETRSLSGGLTVESSGSLLVGIQGGTQAAILNVNGALTQQGAINLGNGQINVAGAYALGGRLSGDGTITANTTAVSGTLAPGHSPALLSMVSDVTILAGSFMEFEIGAPDGTALPGVLSDFLDITGTLTFDGGLAGTINYNFIDGFEPEIGDSFVIAAASGGIFGLNASTIGLGTDIGATISVQGGTDLVLTVTHLPSPGAGLIGVAGALWAARRRR